MMICIDLWREKVVYEALYSSISVTLPQNPIHTPLHSALWSRVISVINLSILPSVHPRSTARSSELGDIMISNRSSLDRLVLDCSSPPKTSWYQTSTGDLFVGMV